MIKVDVLKADELIEVLNKTSVDHVYDQTLKKRIKYFDFKDLDTYYGGDRYFITLFDGEKIIGICKIQHYENNTDSDMSISYFSIDPEYRGMGHTHLMVKKLMELCKKENIVLGTSSWTVSGYNRLRNLLHKYADKYGVKFVDHERLHDVASMYDSNMKYIGDMSDEERKKYDELRNHKYVKSFGNFSYNTGLYDIYATQTSFDFSKVDYFKQLMDDNKYRFFANEGKIAGYIVNNKYYITEGHHRMLAALKHWKNRNDYSRVDKLIKNGLFEEKKEIPNKFYKRFPMNKI